MRLTTPEHDLTVEFTVNGGSSVESGVSLTVGDVIACSGEGALLDRWRNGDAEIYGKTLRISQSGSFNYECSVFVECGTGMFCPFTKNISGFARGISIISLNLYGCIGNRNNNIYLQ